MAKQYKGVKECQKMCQGGEGRGVEGGGVKSKIKRLIQRSKIKIKRFFVVDVEL